jgi:isopentenyl-diphosphate delta-isomerase
VLFRSIYHGQNLLLQQRAAEKYHSGGLWANACCSHPQPGESVEQAAARRLGEELGLNQEQLPPFTPLFSFIYRAEFASGLIEHELDQVLLLEHAGPFFPQPAEISALRWLSCDQLEAELARQPEQFAVWFRLAAPRVIAAVRAADNPDNKNSEDTI